MHGEATASAAVTLVQRPILLLLTYVGDFCTMATVQGSELPLETGHAWKVTQSPICRTLIPGEH